MTALRLISSTVALNFIQVLADSVTRDLRFKAWASYDMNVEVSFSVSDGNTISGQAL